MSTLSPRQMKALKTKKRIVETALSLFSKRGYDEVTVDEIVQASSTSKGAFYGHFKSKYEVFLEKFKEIDEFYETFQAELLQHMKAEDKIIQLGITQMDYLQEDLGKDLLRTVYLNALTPNSHHYLSDTDRKLYAIIESFVKEGQGNGEFDKMASSQEITMIISRCMRGTLYDWLIFENDFNLVSQIEVMLRTVLAGIKQNK